MAAKVNWHTERNYVTVTQCILLLVVRNWYWPVAACWSSGRAVDQWQRAAAAAAAADDGE